MKNPKTKSILIVALLGPSLSAPAQQAAAPSADASATRRFDGVWDVTVSCPDANENGRRAKGYVLRFSVEVKNGTLHGH
jgi:hypothetical protein